MSINKYVDNAGYIDVRSICMKRNDLLAEAKRREQDIPTVHDLNRDFALYILGCLFVTGCILYFGT
jgi:hypothetical protein